MAARGTVARRRGAGALAGTLAVCLLAGCVADPPPPTVVGEERSDGEAVHRSSNGVLLALDRVDAGFNPHLLTDLGVDTDLAASLMLPSAFRPGPGGERVLNRDLLESAEPLADDPRTVRYTLRPLAQWSDGVPVAAEDFEYLWQQMTTQPGVVDPAGYERIVEIRPGAGGKVVDVVFDSPPTGWTDLFDALLPAHLLKDAPNGFQGAMTQPPMASAGPFMIRVADLGRGEIEFVRNDRYWADAPPLDQILVRRATGAGQLGAALRSGPGSVALVDRTPTAVAVNENVPETVGEEVSAATQLELTLNTAAPATSDLRVRRALAAAMRPGDVGAIVGEGPDASVSPFPFPRGTGTTGTDDPDAVSAGLTAAGYTRTGDRWERDGEPLSVTLGVDDADDRGTTAAYAVVDQLRSAGIGARVWELDGVALYADALPHGLVDAVVGWQRVDGDPATAAVSRFACSSSSGAGADPASTSRRTRAATTVSSLIPPEPDTGRTTAPATPPSPTPTPSAPPRTIGAEAPARASGISGVCDAEMDRALADVTGAGGDDAPALRRVGDLVADRALRVPLLRPAYLLAGSGDVGVVGGPGTGSGGAGSTGDAPRLVTDVFDTAPTWRRNG